METEYKEKEWIEIMLYALAREIAKTRDPEHLERLKHTQMNFHRAKLELNWINQ